MENGGLAEAGTTGEIEPLPPESYSLHRAAPSGEPLPPQSCSLRRGLRALRVVTRVREVEANQATGSRSRERAGTIVSGLQPLFLGPRGRGGGRGQGTTFPFISCAVLRSHRRGGVLLPSLPACSRASWESGTWEPNQRDLARPGLTTPGSEPWTRRLHSQGLRFLIRPRKEPGLGF